MAQFSFGDDAVSNYFRQRLDGIQGNPDPFAASEELRKLNRYSEYLASQQLPAGLGNYVQNQMIANPMGPSYQRAAESAMYDLDTLYPSIGADRLGGMAQQAMPFYLPQQHAPPAPAPGAGTAMQQRITGGGSQSVAGMPGVGHGSVNGQFAIYPQAGQVSAYEAAMAGLGMDPSNVNTFSSEEAFNRARAAGLDRQNQEAAARSAADYRVLVQGKKNEGTVYKADSDKAWHEYIADKRLAGTQYNADQRLAGTKHTADQRLKGTQYNADERTRSYAAKNEADLERERLKQGGAKDREGMRQEGQDRRKGVPGPGAGSRLLDKINGMLPNQLPGQGSRQPTGPNPFTGIPPSAYGPTRGVKPMAEQVMQQLPSFARAKYVDFVQNRPGFEEAFLNAPEERQLAFLRHLTTGKDQ